MLNIKSDFLFYLKLIVLSNFIHNQDFGKYYKAKLSNEKIKEVLQKQNIDKKIIKFIDKNINYEGKFKYLVNSDDLECMIYEEKNNSHNNLYIIFNGTEFEFKIDFFKDVITFLKLNQEKLDNGVKIHSGYYNILFENNILDKIYSKIKNNKYDNIFITGHSSGGGIATILSYLLNIKFPNIIINLIPFASIKVGNKKFIDYLNSSKNIIITPIINSHDLVPILPPFDCYKNIKKNITIYEDKIKFNQNIKLKNNYSIPDHFTIQYIKNIYYNIA